MDWFPIVAVTFKVLVLVTGMFFAIKWHYDQGRKNPDQKLERRAVLRRAAMIGVVFVLLMVGLVWATLYVARKLGMDLNLP